MRKGKQSEMIWKLKPAVQNYDWGSKRAFSEHFGWPELEKPVAEIWFGSHPRAPAQIEVGFQWLPLTQWLAENGARYQFPAGGLEFLLKVLAAEQPLSLQTHPGKSRAQKKFEEENQAGIPLDSPQRSYPDNNHKPEMILALGPVGEDRAGFEALCGFRPLEEIRRNLAFLSLEEESLRDHKSVFNRLLQAGTMDLENWIERFNKSGKNEKLVEWQWVSKLIAHFGPDPGVFAPLFLKYFRLEPGEALFLEAGVLHSYLRGFGLEIMANSDNVLRGGLTKKYINKAELAQCLDFDVYKSGIIKVREKSRSDGEYTIWEFPQLADEFILKKIDFGDRNSESAIIRISLASLSDNRPGIGICTRGNCQVRKPKGEWVSFGSGAAFLLGIEHLEDPEAHPELHNTGFLEVKGEGDIYFACTP